MVSKEALRQVVLLQREELQVPKETIPREQLDHLSDWFKDNRLIIITGIRRCGKSTILKQIMAHKESFCYVNFENERFLEFQAQDFELLQEVLMEVYGHNQLYFFDEIQNIDKFESFVRRLHDQGKKMFITGSNASLLSPELGTKLTGRYKQVDLFPFSFREFLLFHKIKPEKEWPYITEKKVQLQQWFTEFLSRGGFPEYLINKDDSYLQTIYENIIYRDIVARYAIKKQKILKELVNLLLSNISSPFTYNSLKESLGLANSITVKEYISYLSNSYLLFEVPRFDFSVRKQLAAPKKIYSIDQGMYRLAGLHFSENKGSILENTIFIELKRRGKEIYYYSQKRECDFIIKAGAKITEAIQVCFSLNQANQGREIAGLLEALAFFKLSSGTIITMEQEEEIARENKTIRIIPAWKWLLRKE